MALREQEIDTKPRRYSVRLCVCVCGHVANVCVWAVVSLRVYQTYYSSF